MWLSCGSIVIPSPQLPPVPPVGFRHLLPGQSTQLSFWRVFEAEQTGKNDSHMCVNTQRSGCKRCSASANSGHTCRCRGASVQRSSVEPSSAWCWRPASWPPAGLPLEPATASTRTFWSNARVVHMLTVNFQYKQVMLPGGTVSATVIVSQGCALCWLGLVAPRNF